MRSHKWTLLAVLLVAGAILILARTGLVKVVKTEVRAKPDFLSGTLAHLQRGDRVELLSEAGNGWLLVSFKGQKGYIHQAALESASTSLSGIIPGGKGAEGSELDQGVKGLNPQVEQKMRGSKGYNYADLDWVMKQNTNEANLRKFVEEGKLK